LEWFKPYDLLLSPTVPVLPPKVGIWNHLSAEEMFAHAIPLGLFTAIFNVTQQPAASVPGGVSTTGLPIGIQLVGKPADDRTVLAVAAQLEKGLPWVHRRAEWPAATV